MRSLVQGLTIAVLLLGCTKKDPIDTVVEFASNEQVLSYPYVPIDLPQTATPEQLISALMRRGALRGPLIKRVREVQLPQRPDAFGHYTAVLLDSLDGQKVVLLKPLRLKDGGWYFKIYDSK